jgi:brefeldin A-inhibited guanine nucleotide-exchange protein
MEKFAECFTSQNEGVFQSADTAFILAFSVIMLQTDLHNPNIKPEKKMTVEMFIRNNKGISVDGGDLPDDFLAGIYQRILAQPFTLKEDDEARALLAKTSKAESGVGIDVSIVFGGASEEDKRRERFAKERETMVLKSEQLFRKRQGKTGTGKVSNQAPEYVSPTDAVKLMFNVTWSPLLGALSQVIEMAHEDSSIKLCMNAISYSVRIAAYCDITVARETFVNSLAKFTTLGSIKQMQKKNIECIMTLLDIAADDGEYLGESWTPVLQCISQLGRLRLSASGLVSDRTFLGDYDASRDPLNKRQVTKIEVNLF